MQARKADHTPAQGTSYTTYYNIIWKGGGVMTADTVNLIVQIISNVGFPIACVCVMFWLQYKERENHAEESQKCMEALSNNTLAIKELTEYVKASRN